MIPFLKNLFKSYNERGEKLFNQMKKISELSADIAEKKSFLRKEEYDILTDIQKEVYMSMTDFLTLMDQEDISLEHIVKRCKHVSELNKSASVVEMFSVVEDGHIVLCPNKSTCEKHKNCSGNKIRIVTVREIS